MRRTGLVFLCLLIPACGEKRERHLEHFQGRGALELPKLAPLDAFSLPENPAVADRVFLMSQAEAARRLGAHRCQAEVRYRMAGKDEALSLTENDTIVTAQNGDFRVKVENDAGHGYEAVFSGGRFFLKNRWGPYHERDTLLGDPEKYREQAFGAMAAVYRLFRGRWSFAKQGVFRHHGRDAARFSVALAAGEPRLPGTPATPAVPPGVKKYVYPVEETPAEAERYRDRMRPRELRGTVAVDTDSGALLSAEVTGSLLADTPDGEAITMEVSARFMADGFGNPPLIPPPGPGEIKPIPQREVTNNRVLDFYFGKGFTSTLGPPAGVTAPLSTPNP